MGKQITPSEQFPVPPTSSQIIGRSANGENFTLIRIDEVEEYQPDGSYEVFVRVTVLNPRQKIQDTFYFETRNYKVSCNFIQTNEDTMELLTLYMMMIQDRADLNKFVVEVVKKMQSDFGFESVSMVKHHSEPYSETK